MIGIRACLSRAAAFPAFARRPAKVCPELIVPSAEMLQIPPHLDETANVSFLSPSRYLVLRNGDRDFSIKSPAIFPPGKLRYSVARRYVSQ